MNDRISFWGLVTVCILLGLAVLIPYREDEKNILEIVEKETVPRKQDFLQQVVIYEVNHYSAIIERPLFNPERTSLEVSSKVDVSLTPKKVIPEPPTLLGIMRVMGGERAFVLGRGEGAVMSLEKGDNYQKWKVTKINTNKIVMTYDSKDVIVTMDRLGKGELQEGSKNVTQQLPASPSPLIEEQMNAVGSTRTLKDTLDVELIGRL